MTQRALRNEAHRINPVIVGSGISDWQIGRWISNQQTLPAARAAEVRHLQAIPTFDYENTANAFVPIIGGDGQLQPRGLIQIRAEVHHASAVASKANTALIFGVSDEGFGAYPPGVAPVVEHRTNHLLTLSIDTGASPTRVDQQLGEHLKGRLPSGSAASGQIAEAEITVDAENLPDPGPRVWGDPDIVEFDTRGLRYLFAVCNCDAATAIRFIVKQL